MKTKSTGRFGKEKMFGTMEETVSFSDALGRNGLLGLVLGLVLVVALAAASVSGCDRLSSPYDKYTDSFFDTFDTVITLVMYAKTEPEFDSHFQSVKARFLELHKLYDIYNTYDGVNNIKTINDNAGVSPVEVPQEIIDLILFSKECYLRTGGQANIAMGSVLSLWHEYRVQGLRDPENASLPPMALLEEAAFHADMDKVVVDTENNTVFLADGAMSLDVGAVAKGYAAEIVAKELMDQGVESAMLSAGGQIRTIGKPLDGFRERWGVGVQDPDRSYLSDDSLLDVIYLNDGSVANSGDYQRYYTVDNKRYHHLIDSQSLMPAEYYRVVTVVAEDAGLADFLSTALFLLPYEESRALAEELDGVEAMWIMPHGEIATTDGMKKIMKSHGASGAKPQ